LFLRDQWLRGVEEEEEDKGVGGRGRGRGGGYMIK